MVFPVAVAHCSLCATIGAMDSCYLFPENDSSVKPIAAEANPPNQLKIKWGLDGTTINCLFETWSASNRQHQTGRTNEKRSCCKAKYAAARFRQEADASLLILLSCPGSLH
jgi:hypothetical protein